MRIFCDTNIVTELLQERSQVELVDRIFEAAEINKWQRVLSVGSFYTITYIVERFLKAQNIHKPELVEQQRDILSQLLDVFIIQDLDHSGLKDGVTDSIFSDLEDSYQYQCALKAKCDILLTINKKDFPAHTSLIKILTPREFIDSHKI